MQTSKTHIFAKYEEAVREHILSLSRSRAIKLSNRAEPGLITPAKIGKLYASLDCDGWKESVGTNWKWRYTKPGKTDSKEVMLERAIAKLDESRWACQMSTSSGVEGQRLHQRRAIDLVRHIGPRQYSFIELKTGSNNPLYAAFEILGYALAYLHASAHRWKGSGKYDVFDAEKIELTVLGPESWYLYSNRGIAKCLDDGLEWFANEISDSLNGFVNATLEGKPTFTMKFRRYAGDEPDLDRQAANIDQDAESWRSS